MVIRIESKLGIILINEGPKVTILCCCSINTKWVINSWLRPGSSYTSNGITEFLNQSSGYLSDSENIFFRADSGYFFGSLFDWLEEQGWDYLIKVKLKGIKDLLDRQHWTLLAGITLTKDFWANDILWQLSVLAYNL